MRIPAIAVHSFVLAAALAALAGDAEKPAMSFFDLKANKLDGTSSSLADYKGKVVLVVNTASECGFTPQYKGLQELSDLYKDKGAVVLGFPSNDFGGQEPGSPAQIREFCDRKYSVKFPLFEKVKTKGEGKSPVYAFLTERFGEPKWNFHKYLVGKDGQVLAAFPSKVTPESKELHDAIDAALK
jgi:glutathione peroxidase